MRDPRRHWFGIAFGLIVLALALYEAHNLAQAVRDQSVRRRTPPPGRAAPAAPAAPHLAQHVALLGVLLAAAGAWLYWLGRRSAVSPPSALGAYEEAMGRLRDRGAAISRHYEAERQRLLTALDERDTMARAGELTSGIVHEVRNGLATITGYAQLIGRGGATDEVADAARRIEEECRALDTVVRRFVDFVRHEELHLADVDLGRMLSRVAAREGRSRAGGEVVLPASLDLGTVQADEELLETAFENVVRNAREASGPQGHVWIQAGREGSSTVVVVGDDGPGLPEANDALRPFFTTKAGGLGLGLPIALKIVHLHGGDLRFQPRLPTGLEVTIQLPGRAGS